MELIAVGIEWFQTFRRGAQYFIVIQEGLAISAFVSLNKIMFFIENMFIILYFLYFRIFVHICLSKWCPKKTP